MAGPFDRLRDEFDISVRDTTDNTYRLSTTDPDAPAKWGSFLGATMSERDQQTGAAPGTSFRQYFMENIVPKKAVEDDQVRAWKQGSGRYGKAGISLSKPPPDDQVRAWGKGLIGGVDQMARNITPEWFAESNPDASFWYSTKSSGVTSARGGGGCDRR